MRVGFFLALRDDVSHYLHAASLVRDVARRMPGTSVVHLTDGHTPAVDGAEPVRHITKDGEARPLLQVRLELYAGATAMQPGPWLLLDTDVSVRNDVRGVFDDTAFDVAVCDRHWPHVPQGEKMLHEMPFNTGVVFSRSETFWRHVLQIWRAYPDAVRADWMSEQRAVYGAVRSGLYRVKILPGHLYNYPPATPVDIPVTAAMIHYKGKRKPWLSAYATHNLARPLQVAKCA